MNLIDKDALVAEIEKFEKALKNSCKPNPFGNTKECMTAAELQVLDMVKETIDTLEVKEVDLEKEYKDFVELVNGIVGKAIAKHFFELGLKARQE